ncbi:TPA: two-component system response regulator [bacterium]|nr:two-component system response regulator [bacterium]
MKKILLVEDEEDLVETGSFFLQSAGYDVCVARDGLSAMEAIYDKKPDLIVLDIALPEMDGYQVCRMVKNSPLYKDIPIIMLTAKTLKADKFRGIETGADKYITKPYSPEELLSTVSELL